MRYATIHNNVVTNIIECDETFAASVGAVLCPTGHIGDLYADGVFVTPEPPAGQIHDALVERVKSLRDAKAQAGGYMAAGKWFHSDTFSRTQQLGLVIMGAAMPPGLTWKTMDGSFVDMTPALASQVFAAAAQQDAALFAHAEALIAELSAAADPASVDISAGWPTTFGGI